MSYCQWCDGGPECPNSINAKNHSDYVSGLKAENARLKEQVGSLRWGYSKIGCLSPGEGGKCQGDEDGNLCICCKALTDTDGEAWLNEERAKVWEEAAEESRDRDDSQMRNFCNAQAKALRSKGGERAT